MTDKLPDSFASTDALLTAYFKAQDRIHDLEREVSTLKADLSIARNNAEIQPRTGDFR